MGGTINWGIFKRHFWGELLRHQQHMPMVMERLKGSGMLRYEVDKGLAGGGPGAPAPFVAACHLYFNAATDFQKGIAAHGTEIMGDIPNYTDISPQIQISEIVVG